MHQFCRPNLDPSEPSAGGPIQNITAPMFLGSSCDKKICRLQVQAGITDDYRSVSGLVVDSRLVSKSSKKKAARLNLRAA